jgi:hypothetical protein
MVWCFFCPYCGFQLLVLHALVFHTLGFCVLGTGFSASRGFMFFFVPVDLSSGPACTLVPYIRVLCPWDWISASRGLIFFLVPVDWSFWSCIHSQCDSDDANAWSHKMAQKFNNPLLCCMHSVCGEVLQTMCTLCMVYRKVLNEMWQGMRCTCVLPTDCKISASRMVGFTSSLASI